MFNVGDLVSWRGTKELGIVIDKRSSALNDGCESVLVRFIESTSSTRDASWYDSKYFFKVQETI